MSSRIRLCIVTPHHPRAAIGGAELQIDWLLQSLLPQGRYDISYVTRSVNPDYQPEGYRIVRLGRRNRAPRFGYAMDAVPLYRRLHELQPQVIYQRVACGYSGVSAFYARRNNARMIWHVAHDMDLTGRTLDGGRNPVRRVIESACISYAIRHANYIVTQTRHQSRLLEDNHGRTAAGIVPNFHPEPVEQIDKSGPLTVLWVANLKRWKRPELFVDLAAALVMLPDVRFVMVGSDAVGSGDRDWCAALMQKVAELPNLQFLGAQTQAAVHELMARAHVLVNTSEAEGFPNTFIQAWMRMVPVVSLDVDPDGVLERERIGVCARTPAELVASVRNLLVNASLRTECGTRARNYALATHSLRNVRLLQNLIDTAAAAGSSRNGGATLKIQKEMVRSCE